MSTIYYNPYWYDDGSDYDRDDPKHVDFAEMWFAYADHVRKQEKENGLAEVLLREDEALD